MKLTIHEQSGPAATFGLHAGHAVALDDGARDRLNDLYVTNGDRELTPQDGKQWMRAVEALYSRYAHAFASITEDDATQEAQYAHFDGGDGAFHTLTCTGCRKSSGMKEVRQTPDGWSHVRCDCGHWNSVLNRAGEELRKGSSKQHNNQAGKGIRGRRVREAGSSPVIVRDARDVAIGYVDARGRAFYSRGTSFEPLGAYPTLEAGEERVHAHHQATHQHSSFQVPQAHEFRIGEAARSDVREVRHSGTGEKIGYTQERGDRFHAHHLRSGRYHRMKGTFASHEQAEAELQDAEDFGFGKYVHTRRVSRPGHGRYGHSIEEAGAADRLRARAAAASQVTAAEIMDLYGGRIDIESARAEAAHLNGEDDLAMRDTTPRGDGYAERAARARRSRVSVSGSEIPRHDAPDSIHQAGQIVSVHGARGKVYPAVFVRAVDHHPSGTPHVLVHFRRANKLALVPARSVRHRHHGGWAHAAGARGAVNAHEFKHLLEAWGRRRATRRDPEPSRYLVRSNAAVRVWHANSPEHARERHRDAFPDEPIHSVRPYHPVREARLLERDLRVELESIRRLRDRAATPGEHAAASAAYERISARLARTQKFTGKTKAPRLPRPPVRGGNWDGVERRRPGGPGVGIFDQRGSGKYGRPEPDQAWKAAVDSVNPRNREAFREADVREAESARERLLRMAQERSRQTQPPRAAAPPPPRPSRGPSRADADAGTVRTRHTAGAPRRRGKKPLHFTRIPFRKTEGRGYHVYRERQHVGRIVHQPAGMPVLGHRGEYTVDRESWRAEVPHFKEEARITGWNTFKKRHPDGTPTGEVEEVPQIEYHDVPTHWRTIGFADDPESALHHFRALPEYEFASDPEPAPAPARAASPRPAAAPSSLPARRVFHLGPGTQEAMRESSRQSREEKIRYHLERARAHEEAASQHHAPETFKARHAADARRHRREVNRLRRSVRESDLEEIDPIVTPLIAFGLGAASAIRSNRRKVQSLRKGDRVHTTFHGEGEFQGMSGRKALIRFGDGRHREMSLGSIKLRGEAADRARNPGPSRPKPIRQGKGPNYADEMAKVRTQRDAARHPKGPSYASDMEKIRRQREAAGGGAVSYRRSAVGMLHDAHTLGVSEHPSTRLITHELDRHAAAGHGPDHPRVVTLKRMLRAHRQRQIAGMNARNRRYGG